MKKTTKYEASDGTLFDCEQDCYEYESRLKAMEKLNALIDKEIPYSENKDMVRDFLTENVVELCDLLPILNAESPNVPA